jgi:hypothetical protein
MKEALLLLLRFLCYQLKSLFSRCSLGSLLLPSPDYRTYDSPPCYSLYPRRFFEERSQLPMSVTLNAFSVTRLLTRLVTFCLVLVVVLTQRFTVL